MKELGEYGESWGNHDGRGAAPSQNNSSATQRPNSTPADILVEALRPLDNDGPDLEVLADLLPQMLRGSNSGFDFLALQRLLDRGALELRGRPAWLSAAAGIQWVWRDAVRHRVPASGEPVLPKHCVSWCQTEVERVRGELRRVKRALEGG